MNRCSFCDAFLTVMGSRARTRRMPDGTRHVLMIRHAVRRLVDAALWPQTRSALVT